MVMVLLSSKHLKFWHKLHGHHTIYAREKTWSKKAVGLSIHSSV
jgi:hypothetical protein